MALATCAALGRLHSSRANILSNPRKHQEKPACSKSPSTEAYALPSCILPPPTVDNHRGVNLWKTTVLSFWCTPPAAAPLPSSLMTMPHNALNAAPRTSESTQVGKAISDDAGASRCRP
ncbi:hypothetical protein TraAM80_03814 [Trypanosoma rangeli]|uniref:Uncharacterized protein n=1 Tax=Trypanosoma rangeli TaxID=5698 RepID=A0A422NNC4_TRYRA|nr:uncharacterized protein TraAM80_03814 [Trypanosoma rangeli]RNF06869.1 hypothetical protein TraAM80_03814 [Trypanosoma rangeli]|eukprot:RNF06869.1 hypothetical protein TraAM80_03814 [Trypanosoma rangeli]